MKYCSLITANKNGRIVFKLVCEDNNLCDFFDAWSYDLSMKFSSNTVKVYSYSVASFLDYTLAISYIYNGLTSSLIIKALESYESYLVFGVDSSFDIASEVAYIIKPTKLSSSSVEVNLAAVNKFIESSDNFSTSLKILEESGVVNSSLATYSPLAKSGGNIVPFQVRNKIKEKSWLAGCIAGDVRKIKRNKAISIKGKSSTVIFSNSSGGDDKTFPYDKAVELMNAATNLRDKLLWILLATTGCRISEALTVLIDDINFEDREIYIISPNERRDVLSDYLSETELNKISHKGRTTRKTYLIRPFDLMFWETLVSYMNDYYKKGASHRFLLQKKDGKPFVNSYKSAYESFQKAALLVTGVKYSPHSLRHLYGYYLKNWIPNSNGGWGLTLDQVRDCMGHSSVESTRRYAREDEVKLASILKYGGKLQDKERYSSVSEKKSEISNELSEGMK